MNEIFLPKDVEYILDTLKNNGFEGYIVGGCVRDSLMGITPKDYDITTNALPKDIINIFDKTFETGIEHGTITVVLNKTNYEITTYRIDGEYENNRKPKEVAFTTNLYEDVKRRDFTINAICYNKDEGIIDYFDGVEDIKKQIIKAVGDPNLRFLEDALRMIRGIRFSSKIGFEIEEETYKAIFTNNHLFKNISAERVREEFTKILLSEKSNKILNLVDTQLMFYFDENFHNYLFENKNLLNEISSINTIYAYSTLFKKANVEEIKYFLEKFKFDNFTIKSCISIKKGMEYPTDDLIEIRKLISTFGEDISYTILDLKEIYGLDVSKGKKFFNQILENNDPLYIKDLKIDGNILKSLGIKGKDIGTTLKFLLNKVLENPSLNEKEKLMEISKNLQLFN